jgi:hypothetical protein
MAKSRKKAKISAAAADINAGVGIVGGNVGGVFDGDRIDWLSGIEVLQLEATPTVIGAFGSAMLRWEVDAGPPVRLSLGGMRIDHAGSVQIHPFETNVYRLFAFAGNESRFLGEVSVAVSLDQCVRRASSNIDELLAGALTGAVNNSGNRYFRIGPDFQPSKPEVTISADRIDFRLKLGAEVGGLPNPDVDVRGSFGMTIAPVAEPTGSILLQTELVARNIDVSVDITFPWHTYLIPGAMIAVPIAASMSEDSATVSFTKGIRTFVKSLNFASPGPGLIKHSVKIYVDGYGDGVVEVEFCPRPRLGVIMDNL